MPVHRHLFRDFSLVYATARFPFEPVNLAEQAERDMADPESERIFNMPLLLDLRSIDLLVYSAEQFKLLLARRQALGVAQPAPPCAYVVRDEGSFGMMRIFTSYADVRGFRHESRTTITTDLSEAVDWIYPQLEPPVGSQHALVHEIKALEDALDNPTRRVGQV